MAATDKLDTPHFHVVEPVKAKKKPKLAKKFYEKELRRLQQELVKLQEWVKSEGLRVVVIFEGRDAAGKGGVIKRIDERMNPRLSGRRRRHANRA